MRVYSLENRGEKSLYQYLFDCIKTDILSGELGADEKLPSKRVLAANQGISIITVENTYEQLMAEGYIYSRPKSGFYVSRLDSLLEEEKTEYEPAISPKPEPINNLINLSSNHTISDNFPFSVWAKLTRRVLADHEQELMISPPAGGIMELREAITKHLHDFRGIKAIPEQVIIGAGTEYLYGLIVQLLGRDKIYGLENPSSKKIRSIYSALGVKISPLEMDSEGVKLSPDNLTVPDIIQISPSHHFPTGIVTSISRRYGLLQWANELEGRYIIEDDYDSELRLLGKPIPSLFSIDATDRVIYFNTFSKSLASTIRISYMVLPMPLLKLYYEKLGFYSCTVSNFEQYTLAAFIREQYFEKHINRMRNYYKGIRDQFLSNIESSDLSKLITVKEENAGLHFLLKVNTNKNDAILKEKAADAGITVTFLSDYYSTLYGKLPEEYNHTAIINYSGLTKEDIPKVVGGLLEAWSE